MESLQTGEPIVEQLRGTDCQYDECGGTLRREAFKGDEAVVCEDCGTPAVRLW